MYNVQTFLGPLAAKTAADEYSLVEACPISIKWGELFSEIRSGLVILEKEFPSKDSQTSTMPKNGFRVTQQVQAAPRQLSYEGGVITKGM